MLKKRNTKEYNLIFILLITFICITTYRISVFAENVNCSVSNESAVVGNDVTVTATFSSQVYILGYDAYIQYDATKLEFKSGSSAGADVSGGNGRIRIYNDNDAYKAKNITVTLTFTVKQPGTHSVYFTADSVIYDDNVDTMNLVASTGTITATTEAPVSSDNNLSNLTVYIQNEDGSTGPGWFWPEFSKDTLEYYLNVENNAKSLAITATANDANATVSLSDTNLVVGNNTISITVKAEDGSTKVYKLIVTKAEKSEETTASGQASDNNVTIGDKTYNVISYNEEMTIPEGYEIIDYDYKGTAIKALKGLGTNIILLGLTDNGTNVIIFVYNEEANDFYRFVTINVNSSQYVILEMTSDLEGISIPSEYTLGTVNIGENVFDVYKKKDSPIYIVYAMDWNGKKGLYYYDSTNKTMMQYFELGVGSISADAPVSEQESGNNDSEQDLKNQQKIMLIIFITILLIMLGIIMALLLSKTKDDNDDAYEEDDDEYEEYEEDDDEYNNIYAEEEKLKISEVAMEHDDAVPENEAVPEEKAVAEEEAVAKDETEENEAAAEEEVAEKEEVVAENKAAEKEEAVAENEAAEKEEAVAENEAAEKEEVVAENEAAEKEEAVAENEAIAEEESVAENKAVAEEKKATLEDESEVKNDDKKNKGTNISKLLEDESKSLDKDELEMVLDELLGDILDGDK